MDYSLFKSTTQQGMIKLLTEKGEMFDFILAGQTARKYNKGLIKCQKYLNYLVECGVFIKNGHKITINQEYGKSGN